jgi:hypothetical protein
MFGAVRAFEMKLKPFQKLLENVKVCNFSSFPSVHVLEMNDIFSENFEIRFSDFRSHAASL